MSKVTKLHPGDNLGRRLLEETLGEIAVKEGFKLPETTAEVDIYERHLDETSGGSRFGTIYEALIAARQVTGVRSHLVNEAPVSGHHDLAARTGDDIDAAILKSMDAAADKDDDD